MAQPVGWMINADAVRLLEGYVGHGLTRDEINKFFDDPATFKLGETTYFADATRAAVFTDYNAMVTGVPQLDRDVTAVVYDNEKWAFTPLHQQQNPAEYEQMAARVAHEYGKVLISTPAVDLVTVNDPLANNSNKYDRYIIDGYAASAARYADVYEIQAQGSESDTAKFASFVQKVSVQAKQANANVTVYAGISTNPDGREATPGELLAAVGATHQYVSGYWLNIPSSGPHCPKCGTPQTSVAVGLLNALASDGTY